MLLHMVANTDAAPMDWKLQDSDDTTHPSVSSSPLPEPREKTAVLIIHHLKKLASDEIKAWPVTTNCCDLSLLSVAEVSFFEKDKHV